MNRETYEALKEIIKNIRLQKLDAYAGKDEVKRMQDWIDEVAKEYQD